MAKAIVSKKSTPATPEKPQENRTLAEAQRDVETLGKRIEGLSRFCFFIREEHGQEIYDFSSALFTLLTQEAERAEAIAKTIGELAGEKGGAA